MGSTQPTISSALLIEIRQQFQTAVQTIEARQQLVSFFLKTINRKTKALATAWLEQPIENDSSIAESYSLQIIRSRFNETSLDTPSLKQLFLKPSLNSTSARSIQISRDNGQAELVVLAVPVVVLNNQTVGAFAIMFNETNDDLATMFTIGELLSSYFESWNKSRI